MGCSPSQEVTEKKKHSKEVKPSDARQIGKDTTLLLTPYQGLSHVDPLGNGTQVHSQAVDAIAAIKKLLLAAFEGVDNITLCREWTARMETLQLSECEAEIVKAAGFEQSPEKFLDEVGACALKNVILCTLLAELMALPAEELELMFPKPGPERESDLRAAVTYCYLQHGFVTMIMQEKVGENTWLEKLSERYAERRATGEWKQYCNLFERMKLPSVFSPVDGAVLDVKSGRVAAADYVPNSCTLLQVNILEACYQDAKLGHASNGAAGFELLCEPALRDPIKGCDNRESYVFDDCGTISHTPSFPVVWNNLYSSWNMAFVTYYKDWPAFFAKLLCPAVLGTYQEPGKAGLYLYPRVLALWLHINQVVFQRVELKSRDPPGLDWRDPMLTALWGKVNEQAGIAFQKRVEEAIEENYGVGREIAYNAKRFGWGCSWATIRGGVRVSTALSELGADECDDFHEVRYRMFGDDHEQERTTGELYHLPEDHPSHTTQLGLPSHVPKSVQKVYVENPGIEYQGIRIEPLDLVFVRGTSFASKISKFLQRNSGCNDVSTCDDFFDLAGEFSHVGMIVTSDILDHPKVEPGKLYIWESTQGGGADIDGGEHTGTQLRDFMKVTDAVIANDDDDYGIAVGKLREDVRKQIDYAEAKETFKEFYDAHNLAPYDFNVLDLADAVHVGPSVHHDETKLFCSQLIAKTFKALKIIPDVHDARVLPMDFLGFDKDKELPVLVHHPYFIAGSRPELKAARPNLAASLEQSARLQDFVRPERSEAMILQSVSSSAFFMAEEDATTAAAMAEEEAAGGVEEAAVEEVA